MKVVQKLYWGRVNDIFPFPRVSLLFAVILMAQNVPRLAHAEKMHCPSITDDNDKNTEIARRYFKTGGMYFASKDYLKAAESFECVLRFVPYSLNARYKLAQSYDLAGVYSRARESYGLILAYESPEAEAVKPAVRKRLDEIKGLADKVQVEAESPAPAEGDDVCPAVVVQGQKNALVQIQKAMQDKNWNRARSLVSDALGALGGATPAQKAQCLASDVGVELQVHTAITEFQLGNLQVARETFIRVLQVRPAAALPAAFSNAALMEFFQKVSSEYFSQLQAEKERLLRIRQLEESGKLPPEPEENPAVPVEHVPPQKAVRGEDLVLFCRVSDEIKAAKVVLVVRFDEGAAQEEVMEKMGRRRYVTVLPGARVQFAKMSYHIEARDAAGNELAAWGREKPGNLELPPEKAPEPAAGPGTRETSPAGVVAGPGKPEEPALPVGKTVPKAKEKPSRSWRIFLAPTYGRHYLVVPSGILTERHAFTDKLGAGDTDASFSMEAGLSWNERNWVSLGMLVNGVNRVCYEDARIDPAAHQIQSAKSTQFFGRYALRFGENRFRPYLGWGGIGGPVRVKVTKSEKDPMEIPVVADTYATNGFFFNPFLGLDVCVLSSCWVSFHLEADFLWKWLDFEAEKVFAAEHAKTFGFWVHAGLAFFF